MTFAQKVVLGVVGSLLIVLLVVGGTFAYREHVANIRWQARYEAMQPGTLPPADPGGFRDDDWYKNAPPEFRKWVEDTINLAKSESIWSWLLKSVVEWTGLGGIAAWLLLKLGPKAAAKGADAAIEGAFDKMSDPRHERSNQAVEQLLDVVERRPKQRTGGRK